MPVQTVDPAAADLIRLRLREMREAEFLGNMSAMARSLGVTAAYLGDVLNGKRGPGMKLLRALAKRWGNTIDEVIHQRSGPVGPAWSALPGWVDALAAARIAYPKVSPDAWRWVGSLAGASPPALTAHVLGPLAVVWDQHAPATSPSAPVELASPKVAAKKPATKKPKSAAA